MCSHPEASFLLSSLLFKPPGSITNWMLLLRLPVCSWLFINSLASINIFLIFAFFSQVIILCSSILTTKGSTDDNAVMSSCVEKLRTVSGGLCCRCWERFWDIRGDAANICLDSSGCLAFRNSPPAPVSPVLFDPWHSCEWGWDWTWPQSQPDSVPVGLVSTTFGTLLALSGCQEFTVVNGMIVITFIRGGGRCENW